jgi:hypothetical protein
LLEWKLAEEIVQSTTDRCLGRSDHECLGNFPRDVYFIGNLRPRPQEGVTHDVPAHLDELRRKLAPMAFGLEFEVTDLGPDGAYADVEVIWSCYYRVFPTFVQQQRHQLSTDAATVVNAPEAVDAGDPDALGEGDCVEVLEQEAVLPPRPAPRPRGRTDDSLFLRFRKVQCRARGRMRLALDDTGVASFDIAEIQSALDAEVARAQQVVLSDPEALRTAQDNETRITVPADSVSSPEAFDAFANSLTVQVRPVWRWEVRPEVRPSATVKGRPRLLIVIDFVNASDAPDRQVNTETFLFDTQASVSLSGCTLAPFELSMAPGSFREDRRMWGKGRNCAVLLDDGPSARLVTTHVPIYRQMRYQTRTIPEAPFATLAQDPLPVLASIRDAMHAYMGRWDEALASHQASGAWSQASEEQFLRDREQFLEGIRRFEAGIELTSSNPDVRLAFQLTNQVFARWGRGRTAWRLFQAVFLVSQLPGITALSDSGAEEREKVDIIYFPTGSGKTEAYLAVVVFNCFWDRLRGKTAGVTAWARFPLRLLTVQQMQRVADVIGIAELVRREQTDTRLTGKGIDGFAVGYFVGEGATPNKICRPAPGDITNADWSMASDEERRQAWKTVPRCPSCGTASVRVDFDQERANLIHRCLRPGCAFADGVLPVYVVDNELFRYLPSVIVGTIDKLALLGVQRKMSLVFGHVQGRCSLHGYYSGKCCQNDCKDTARLRRGAPRGLSGPTLFIQDELHLLREGLGTFDSHYETFAQHLLREFGAPAPLKIIASSATVEAFDRQVEHLYCRRRDQARVFPGAGPVAGESFYAETLPYPQRLYVGLLPHNKTLFNAMLELMEYYHQTTQDIARQGSDVLPELADKATTWASLTDLYMTSLTYFLAVRDLYSLHTDLDSYSSENLQRDGHAALRLMDLTGSTTTDEVTQTLEYLQEPERMAAGDAVLATSMISHGVDIDRLNAMFFYGVPRQNAEYVQASSRVGRRHVGIVFTCMHPARERDQSHYSYFTKYHEFLGQMIEPVAINRWSRFSVGRTLPGLFMATLLQLIASRSNEQNPNRYYLLDFVKRKVSSGELTPEAFVGHLFAAYGVAAGRDSDTDVTALFRDEIEKRVVAYLYDQITGASPSETWVSGALIPPPMRSLREVDEQLEVELDQAGSAWADAMSRSR